jgi:hypothetical protein
MFHLYDSIKRRGRQAIIILFNLGAIGCIIPSQNPYLKWWTEHALHIAIFYLVLGLLFLLFNQSRMMFVCMGCSAVICFFNHEKSNASVHQNMRIMLNDTTKKQIIAPISTQDEPKKNTQ